MVVWFALPDLFFCDSPFLGNTRDSRILCDQRMATIGDAHHVLLHGCWVCFFAGVSVYEAPWNVVVWFLRSASIRPVGGPPRMATGTLVKVAIVTLVNRIMSSSEFSDKNIASIRFLYRLQLIQENEC